jgi:serine/threonine protein kinase
VEVLRHGEKEYMSLYYIDMELCDLNLENYIAGHSSSTVSIEWQALQSANIHIPANVKLAMILSIMNDITDGLVFMHSRKVIHRDLKPPNSNLLLKKFD